MQNIPNEMRRCMTCICGKNSGNNAIPKNGIYNEDSAGSGLVLKGSRKTTIENISVTDPIEPIIAIKGGELIMPPVRKRGVFVQALLLLRG